MGADFQGSTFGQYEVRERIGQGGMGAVYRAYQPSLDRFVALKILIPDRAGDDALLRRFRLEAWTVAHLKHPAILPIHDLGQHDDVIFIVMPLVEGGTMRDHLDRGEMSLGEGMKICVAVADALDFAHANGVIHRDVKPPNVLLDEMGYPLLADFGIAKILQGLGGLTLTGTGMAIGTPEYMSPEQCLDHDVDGRTDQYALASIAFELLAGRVPYTGKTREEVVVKQVSEPVPHVSDYDPMIPDTVDAVLAKALAKHPDDRYESCSQLMRDLQAAEGWIDLVERRASVHHPAAPRTPRAAVGADLATATDTAPRAVADSIPRQSVETPPDTPAAPARARLRRVLRAWPILAGSLVMLTILQFGGVAIAMLRPPATPASVGPFDGLFNVAIADFGEVDDGGDVRTWADGSRLGASVYQRLENELERTPALTGKVKVWHEGVDVIRGRNPSDRAVAASALAEQTRANLVIYGNLERRGSQAVFAPEFYVSGLEGAEELLGPTRLGRPLPPVGRVEDPGYTLVLSDMLKTRTEALTNITLGMTYLAMREPGSAIEYFQRARDTEDWPDADGKEVVYLSLGTAYRMRDQAGDLDLARDAYQTAATLSPEYARAYIGLGNVSYEEFKRSNGSDLPSIDRAISEYERAAVASIRPETAYVDAKVHVSLGNAYVVKAQAGAEELYSKAQAEYMAVVEKYEGGQRDLQPFVAPAYIGLGVIQEMDAQDDNSAATYYREALASAAGNRDVEQTANSRLRAIGAEGL